MCDLMLLAWQLDKARVTTLIFNRDVSHMRSGFLDGVQNEQLHGISHHKEDPAKLASYQRINQFHAEQFAYLMGRMKQVDEGHGTTLRDNVMLQFGSNMFNGGSENKTDAQLLTQSTALNQVAGELSKLGITLAYHNHDSELREGAREFHHVLTATDHKP